MFPDAALLQPYFACEMECMCSDVTTTLYTQLSEEELEALRHKARPDAAILNETSYDRRRVAAVYTQDGRRGHHMQAREMTCFELSAC